MMNHTKRGRKQINLARLVKSRLAVLRSAYSTAASKTARNTFDEWLCDNYYLLDREGRQTAKVLKEVPALPCGNLGVPRIFELCTRISQSFKPGEPEDTQRMIFESLRGEKLSTRELEYLPPVLRAAIISRAAGVAGGGCALQNTRPSGTLFTKEGLGVSGTTDSDSENQKAEQLGGCVQMIRALPSVDFDRLLVELCEVEKILAEDPAGVYTKMDEQTKSQYRHRVVRLAGRSGKSETEVAREAIEFSRCAQGSETHVGHFLFERHKTSSAAGYGKLVMWLRAAAALTLSLWLGLLARNILVFLLVILPVYKIIEPLFHMLAVSRVRSNRLKRLDFEGSVPPECRTLIVVSSLLPKPGNAAKTARRLDEILHTNKKGAVRVCLLADLREASLPNLPDDPIAVASMAREIRRLNRQYGDRFYFVVRPREYSKTQNAYSGYERKRGAITQLIRIIKGRDIKLAAFEGNREELRKTKYILALDSDTELLLDTASELVSVAEHPLNRPVINREKGIVEKGYGIIAPKVSTDIGAAGKTVFSRVMAGAGGITVYDNSPGDFYQDMFGEAIFSGKGLINVDAFYELLDDAFSDGQILSHDILEGGFLRTAYMGDCEITDGYPSTGSAWLARLHRWVRGDWQNISFLFSHINAPNGKIKNPMNGLSRYKLLDNLVRSITPVMALACLVAALFFDSRSAGLLCITAFLSTCSGELLSAVRGIISGGIFMLSRKYYSKALPGAMEDMVRGFVSVIMQIPTAIICGQAIILALYRKFVSGKKLLEWVTAADSERKTTRFIGVIKDSFVTLALGVIFLLLSHSQFVRLAGIFALASVVFLAFSGIIKKSNDGNISPIQRERLLSYAAAMWRYYDEYAGAKDNWLPPDNMQESPAFAVAHRTSPTNIGLMLLCLLAARDFKFIDNETLFSRVSHTIDSIEALEKWNGNLLNWYDTQTLKPLYPRYCSAVDSGNFACCLIALREGLLEYADASNDISALIGRIAKLIAQTDLTHMYNARRRLFHIGYDIESGKLSGSYYDLLMSEARMTSYFAIATRQIRKKHWGTLSRTLAKEGGYAGPVSWTGTMFEYFMPHLLLPVYDGTLGYEALKFCVYCQQKRVAHTGAPWGCSESGFYAFDAQFNYQYKAHGVQRLGLKQGLNNELVVSPYSSFLALLSTPQAAMRNLLRLKKSGLYGKCGFYEAADFTSSRVNKREYSVVRSYMAHHVGMSLLSVSNLLFDNILQKRFMRNEEMNSAKTLLCEKIPSGTMVFEDIVARTVPERVGRNSGSTEEYDEISPGAPRMHLLSNRELTCLVSDCGSSLLRCRGLDITRHSGDLLRRPQGVFAAVSTGSSRFMLTKAPNYDPAVKYRAEFATSYAAFYAKTKELETGMMTSVHKRFNCEQRQFIIKNRSAKKLDAELLIYFEPCLARQADDAAHPSFSKLFLQSEYDSRAKAIHFSRRQREKDIPAHLAAGFLDAREFEVETLREKVLTRPFGVASLLDAKISGLHDSGLPDPCAAIKIKLSIPPRSSKSATLLICFASTYEETDAMLAEVRAQGEIPASKAAVSPLADMGLETRLAAMILPQLFYPSKPAREWSFCARENNSGVSKLWAAGISGDLPIVLIELSGANDISRAVPLIRILKKLRGAGVHFDLAVAFTEGGEYARPMQAALREAVQNEDAEHLLHTRGGIHPVDCARFEDGVKILLGAAAIFVAPVNFSQIKVPPQEYKPMRLLPVNPSREASGGLAVIGGRFSDNRFEITTPPRIPWCHVLANPGFGTLVSDKALGFTFCQNARENKLSPWFCDTMSDNGGELLILRTGGKAYDLINGSRAAFTCKTAEYKGHADSFKSEISVWISPHHNVKFCEVNIENRGDEDMEFECAYYVEPVLGVGRNSARYIHSKWDKGRLFLHNPFNTAVPGVMMLTEDDGADSFNCDRYGFLMGHWNEHLLAPLPDPCGAVIVERKLPPKSGAKLRFILSFGKDEQDAADASGSELSQEFTRNSIAVNTPDSHLNHMINTWLPLQFENSRINGKTGFYQCGGAWGFRDQLQDVCALLLLDPEASRRHIIRTAGYQFEEGDVLHWWHSLPGEGTKGVRTRCSDDLLWLPYTVCEYVEKTGDYSILDEQTHYLSAPPLDPGEQERYFSPAISQQKDSIFGHCMRAVEAAINLGRHGLPKIGNGDWNDGLNQVGEQGEGESVWLAQFLSIVLHRFALLCEYRRDMPARDKYTELAAKLLFAVDQNAWDGGWYLRAFFDDGTPLGSHECAEGQIDSLPQSFAVLSGMGDRERISNALDNAVERLVDKENGLVKLFTPAYDKLAKNPGYIKSYLPGVRENGGQYTHAAIWLALALLESGRVDQAYELLELLNPARKYLDQKTAGHYQTEPYYLAADVYSAPGVCGRGGWSLYTGAAGWYYRTVVESLLGLKIRGDRLLIEPKLPGKFKGFTAALTVANTAVNLKVKKGENRSLTVDGRQAEYVPLDGGSYSAQVVC